MTTIFKAAAIGALLTIGAFAAGAAKADTVVATVHATIGQPVQNPAATLTWAANPTTPTLSVQVAGKTCSLVSSLQAIGSVGCNYALNVAPDGAITGALTAGNPGCTPTDKIASSCK